MAKKATKKAVVNSVNYDPKSPIGKLFAKLAAAKGKSVRKEVLYKNIGAHAPKLMAWVLIHGRTSGLWTLTHDTETAKLVMTAKGRKAATAAA